MLKTRVITGTILGVLVLLAVFGISDKAFMFATAVFTLLGAWEWSKLAGIETMLSRAVYLVAMLVLMWVAWYLPLLFIAFIACLWWLLALYFIVNYPNKQTVWSSINMRILMGLLVLIPFWLSINAIRSHPHGPLLLMFCFIMVWAADIGAYFAGRRFGKTKLMPKVSPGKSWEGFIGGLLLSMIVASIVSAVVDIHFSGWFLLMLFVILLNIYSVVGDLLESMLKRYCNVKDSGTILPGHGGILDRIDSLTAATPLFLLGLFLYLHF